MKSVGIWLSAASALALTACGQAEKPAAHPAAKVAAAAAPAPAAVTGGAGQQPVAPAIAGQQPAAPAPGEAARSAAASGRAAGRAAHAVVDARLTRPGARRERSVEQADDDTDVLTADLPTGSSDAREHAYSAAYRTCMGSAHGFTAVIADCYNAELVRQGERLNRAFDAAVAARSGERRRRLQLAQRAWLQHRDSTCQEADGPDLLHEGSCRLDLTTKRAAQLEGLAG